jgi:hypothetical protein
MVTRNPRPKRSMRAAVDLAVAAVEGSGHPVDLGEGDLDTSPTSLGLPAQQESTACSHHRFVCALCGTPLRHNLE